MKSTSSFLFLDIKSVNHHCYNYYKMQSGRNALLTTFSSDLRFASQSHPQILRRRNVGLFSGYCCSECIFSFVTLFCVDSIYFPHVQLNLFFFIACACIVAIFYFQICGVLWHSMYVICCTSVYKTQHLKSEVQVYTTLCMIYMIDNFG